ncbi:MAG: M55 family metallopeptidase [Candidatus Ozemobacteraceae bacterium]
MKLYIVADMEGIAGVVSPAQIDGSSSWEADAARRQFTDEVCAVCGGAFEAGVKAITINDFHGGGRNLLIDRLPLDAMLVRGDFRSTAGFDLLDSTYCGLVLLGAHARTASRGAVIPHTYSDKVRFEIFGQPVGEFDLLSLVAGEEKVPTILISGDEKTIEQAHTNLPATHTVITKFGISSKSALCIHPKRVIEALHDEIQKAVKDISSIEPPGIVPPTQLVIRIEDVSLAERIEWIPNLRRLEDDTFEYVGRSMREIARLVYGITILTE